MRSSAATHTDSVFLLSGIAFSIVVHLLAGYFFLFLPFTKSEIVPSVIEVTFSPPIPTQLTPKRQIVTPPDNQKEESPSPETKLLSDIETATPIEQIRRGEDPRAGIPLPQSPERTAQSTINQESNKTPPTQEKTNTNETKSPPRLKSLLLDEKTTRDQFGLSGTQRQKESQEERTRAPQNALAFSRPSGSGASVFGLQGSPDLLPSLPDGDLTLLNAKAEKFAVFVRRVALQVFGTLRQSGWESLTRNDISNISDFTTIVAVLSPKGELLRVTLEGPSGSARFDAVVTSSVHHGARDPNPPAAAVASDGNIHFIFKAKSWARLIPGRRSGFPEEQRWIMLATGLE